MLTQGARRIWPDTSDYPRESPDFINQHSYQLPRGRKSELDVAEALCAQGSGSLIWTGEPGMGKSALLALAADRAGTSGAFVINVPVITPEDPDTDNSSALDLVVRQLLSQPGDVEATGPIAHPAIPPALRDTSPDQSTGNLGRGLADLISAASRNHRLVFIADDLDRVDDVTRRALIGAIVERRASAVLLATATDQNLVRSLPYEIERRPLAPITNMDALALLHEGLGITIAPHVVQILNEHVSGAPTALLETAQSLSSAQLIGWSQMPDPLPVAASTQRAIAQQLRGLPSEDRTILLTAAVAVTDRTDLFLDAIDRPIEELLDSPAASHLRLVAGHVSISDPRIRAAIHANASVAERTTVHQRLAAAHSDGGSHITALWHRALAALTGDASLSDELLTVAERMLRLGDAVWAQRVAREALSHATGDARPHAMVIAGRAALHAGHLSDAVGLLKEASRLMPDGPTPEVRADLLIAVTLSTGQTPEEVIEDDEASFTSDVYASILYGERGDIDEVKAILRRQERLGKAEDHQLDFLRAWLAYLAGDPEPALRHSTHSSQNATYITASRVLRALALTLRGQTHDAHRVLASAIADLSPAATSPWEPALHTQREQAAALTPLLEAYVNLADTLVEYTGGNLIGARTTLIHGAFKLPSVLPGAGLSAAMAGRISVLCDGYITELARVLEELIPVPLAPRIRAAFLMNRTLHHIFAGEKREAQTLLQLSPDPEESGILPLPRPNLRDLHVLAGSEKASTLMANEPDQQESPDARARRDPLSLALDLLTNARREELQSSQNEDSDAKIAEDLYSAAGLFREIGASSAADVAEQWAALSGPTPPPEQAISASEKALHRATSAPAEPVHTADRRLVEENQPDWARTLTEREREVARVIAAGATNREAASQLFVSVRTVEVHLTSIFRKLEIGSRVELAVVVSQAPLE